METETILVIFCYPNMNLGRPLQTISFVNIFPYNTSLCFVCLFVFKFTYLFSFGLRWVFVAACRLPLVAASGGYSLLWCVGSSLQQLLLLQSTGSRHVGFSNCSMRVQQLWHAGPRARRLSSCGSRALECRLSSCGARAQLLGSMWDLPGPGIEPMSPALAGRLLTTADTREIPFPLFLNSKFCLMYRSLNTVIFSQCLNRNNLYQLPPNLFPVIKHL